MRRRWVVGLLAAVVLVTWLVRDDDAPAEGTAPTMGSGERMRLPAVQADSVVDAYGVGIHLPWLDTPYRDVERVTAALQDLGVRHVRDDLHLDHPRQYDAIRRVADAGVRFDLIMGRPDRPGSPADYVRTVADQVPVETVASLEGVNEWDLFGNGRDWASEVASWQEQLHAAAKADPRTADVPVLSPAMAHAESYAELPSLAAYSDKANAHVYPGGFAPAHRLDETVDAVRQAVPDKPLVVTESGYHNAVAGADSHHPVPEDVAATYLPRMLLEHVARGHERVYGYELIDSFDDPGRLDPEANFGLLRHDWSAKPAYDAMKRLLGLLADPGPAFEPKPLAARVEGWPSDGKYLLTQKRDGSYVVLLWRDVRVYDPARRTKVPVERMQIEIELDDAFDMAVHRPSESAEPVARQSGRTLHVPLDGSVSAVTLQPAD